MFTKHALILISEITHFLVSTLSFKNELGFFGIPYNEEDVIDGDKVIAALKKENAELRQQIQAAIEKADELKQRLDKIGSIASGNPHFDSYELVKDLTIVGVAVIGFAFLTSHASVMLANANGVGSIAPGYMF